MQKGIFFLFLVAILLTGTISTTATTVLFPTLSMKEVHAISSDDATYGLNIQDDDRNYYKSKDFSNKKDSIECTNFNFNANGLKNDEIPESLRDLIKTATNQAHTTEEIESEESKELDSTRTSSNDEKRFNSNNDDEDFVTICKNNNDNEQSIPTPPPSPPPPPEDDNVYVVWEDNTNGPDFDIFFRVSHDNGETFEPFIDLSNNTGFSSNPQMVVSGNNVYVVWTDNTNGPDDDIFFRVSHDNGETFEPFIDLSNNTGSSFDPQISVQ
jgi:hypothetical protein